MSRLRLGPVVEEKPVKITIELPGPLFAKLGEYAEVHAKETGLAAPLAVERLVAPMLERFMATDRGFARLRSR
jgi:hypothetical protein